MPIRMGYWDCAHCGHKKIEGPQRECAQCGRPRDDNVEFYTTDDAPEIDDVDLLQRAEAGADWHCPFCDTDNPAGTTSCQSCGGSDPSAKSREVKFIPDDPADAEPSPPPPRPEPAKKKGGMGLFVLLGVLALIGVGVWFLFFRTSELQVTVQKATWTKTLQVEDLKKQNGSAWADAVPSGARELRREMRGRDKKVQQGTKKVKVGKKDLGNGMFKDVYKDKPNYVTKKVDEPWVSYEIEKWVQGRKLKEQRDDDSEPPSPVFSPGTRQRAGKRESFISLALKGSDGKSYDYKVDASSASGVQKARGYQVGKTYTAVVSTVGAVKELKK